MFWYRNMMDFGNWGWFGGWLGWIFPLVIIDFILRGYALWKSARAEQKWWFVALLVVNSVGILPLIYLLTHQEAKSKRK